MHAMNDFAFALWRHVPAGNQVISPLSIAATLAMVWTGARGETARQMAEVLGLAGDVDTVARTWGERLQALRAGQDATLAVANRLFAQHGYTFDEAFTARLATAFGAPLELHDFVRDADSVRRHINTWVAQETQRAIAELLPPNS